MTRDTGFRGFIAGPEATTKKSRSPRTAQVRLFYFRPPKRSGYIPGLFVGVVLVSGAELAGMVLLESAGAVAGAVDSAPFVESIGTGDAFVGVTLVVMSGAGAEGAGAGAGAVVVSAGGAAGAAFDGGAVLASESELLLQPARAKGRLKVIKATAE